MLSDKQDFVVFLAIIAGVVFVLTTVLVTGSIAAHNNNLKDRKFTAECVEAGKRVTHDGAGYLNCL